MNTKNSEPIIIVSGLPRSGTSMMMQILKNGELPVLSDDERMSDVSNPKGYFEYEKVKSLAQNNDWLHLAQGKTLKVIAQLVPFLPNNYRYQIIMMEREMTEILISQQKMLGKPATSVPFALAETFAKQLMQVKQFISNQSNMEMLVINYKNMIEQPEAQFSQLIDFLGTELDTSSMLQSIDVSLYRNKI